MISSHPSNNRYSLHTDGMVWSALPLEVLLDYLQQKKQMSKALSLDDRGPTFFLPYCSSFLILSSLPSFLKEVRTSIRESV